MNDDESLEQPSPLRVIPSSATDGTIFEMNKVDFTAKARTGPALKQLGLYRVESHNTALVKLARAVAKEICGRVGQVTIDQVRDHPAMAGIEPSSPNFWGCLFLEKGWHCIDRQHSVRRTNHAREIKVWRYEGA